MKQLLIGNEAFARGLYEAGCSVVSSYPGTPSTEITEFISKFFNENSKSQGVAEELGKNSNPYFENSNSHGVAKELGAENFTKDNREEKKAWAEWAPNEKVAMETALGASIAGARSFCGMKHVGLNVAADPLYTASYTGVNAGMVIAVADDSGMHSSQNEQDSRHHAVASKVPMLEPSDSTECKEFTKLAFDISEEFDTPVIIRLSTRIAHSQSLVEIGERKEIPLKPYEKNPQKYVMMPAFAKARHVVVEERTKKLTAYAETSPLNSIEDNNTDIGVITNGVAYQYSKEALGDRVSYLKLGIVNPLPVKLIKDFAAKYKTVYIIEELDGIIEQHCKAIGVECKGKEIFGYIGELSQSIIKEKIFGETAEIVKIDAKCPGRPPVMCSGCPHRGVFYTLAKNKIRVSGDIGCYTLGAGAPLFAMDTTICMGASISALHGMNKADKTNESKSVAVIGDSTFIHSGITSLINVSYNATNSTVIILDNSITGMTGHQQNPTTGKNLKGDPATKVDLEALCKAIGINRVTVIDPYNLEETERVIIEELAVAEPSVIIARRPCALLKYVKHNEPFNVNDKCKSCKACLKIGCPSISMNGKALIDKTSCVGCGVCKTLCKFDAIEG
ncbi:MAG: indolepyruvate ferredoxin oxidoreductase subunit alpha [Oscillospiraceae bacterium]|jgi:indolepyruvate ferredoxin oxidoreductase alpha subunit|nr:indolepyruvate ferredoxin oxidoreductase subunit alpha [Oscillospiraceae bacterium]